MFCLFFKSWKQIEELILKIIVICLWKLPSGLQDWLSLSPLPCLWFLQKSMLISCLHEFWPAYGRIRSDGGEPGRERNHPRSLLLFQDHRQQEPRKDVVDLDHPSEATHKTVLAFPLQSTLSFLGSRNQGVETQPSLLTTHFKRKGMWALCTYTGNLK